MFLSRKIGLFKAHMTQDPLTVGNKTLYSNKYMSNNVFSVMALHQHDSFIVSRSFNKFNINLKVLIAA